MEFDKAKTAKILMTALGVGLTLASSLVNSKNQDEKMKEMVSQKVAEAFANQTKES